MCEFCHKHGEGQKWYLRAEHYCEDLLSDVRRPKFIEEIEGIFDFVNSVTRLPCMCRQALLGSEHRYCYALSMVPHERSRLLDVVRAVDSSYLTGPDTGGLEALSNEEALASLKALETKGLCHTVWTFKTPFIGAICNCDRSDCVAMRSPVPRGHGKDQPAESICRDWFT